MDKPAEKITCEVHGENCPTKDGLVVLHSHTVDGPKVFYCEESCEIGECLDKKKEDIRTYGGSRA